jgi:ubiquinol-cytochrome c reductase iron-sulfur subunit
MSVSEVETSPEVDASRRKFLTAATAATGAVGAAFAAAPFLASWKPSERARALGAPTEVDLTKIEPGQMATYTWRKQPIYVVRRTPEMNSGVATQDGQLKDPNSDESEQPQYARNELRSIKPEILVLYATCTHLGCLPKARFEPGDPTVGVADWKGGFFCPCHGSKFDMAGRVYEGSPASTNLRVPPHAFADEKLLVVGVDSIAAAAPGAA